MGLRGENAPQEASPKAAVARRQPGSLPRRLGSVARSLPATDPRRRGRRGLLPSRGEGAVQDRDGREPHSSSCCPATWASGAAPASYTSFRRTRKKRQRRTANIARSRFDRPDSREEPVGGIKTPQKTREATGRLSLSASQSPTRRWSITGLVSFSGESTSRGKSKRGLRQGRRTAMSDLPSDPRSYRLRARSRRGSRVRLRPGILGRQP